MDSTPITLIHLVSDQTMQNILPILALKPARVVQVISDASDESRFLKPAECIREAVELAQRKIGEFACPIDWADPVDLRSPAPSIEDTRRVLSDLLSGCSGAIVNYTGGTKNLSIGAWTAAAAVGAPTLYCDTPRQFLSGGTGVLPDSMMSLEEVARRLTVPILLASQGLKQSTHWNRRGIPDAIKVLGSVSHRLAQTHGEAFRRYRQRLLEHGTSRGSGKPTREDIDRAWDQCVPEPPNPAFTEYLEASREAGLLTRLDDGFYYYRLSQGANGQKLREQVARVAQGLSGAAFEAYTAALLERSRRFSTFLSNVYPAGSQPEEHGFGESDFLAYEPAKLALTLISCKSSPPWLEHLESLLARKARFGGLFARTLLCVEQEVTPDRGRRLRSQCGTLGIDCAIGNEIEKVLGTTVTHP